MIEYESLKKANEPFFAEYTRSFQQTLESGWYILGKSVEKFETEFAAYCGTKYCLGVANGLDALILALRALDLPAGSEVLVPSNTYIATILSIVHCGHIPVLVEPDIRTYTIDPAKCALAISKKTQAMMVVHLYGKACDMDPLLGLCREHNLALIEDCAQAHGATYKGKQVGTFGSGAFSFYPTKNLGCLGDGGAVVTSDERIAAKIKTLRNYGSKVKYYNEVVGYNSRLDEVQAGFLSVKLKHLQAITEHKRALARYYFDHLDKAYIKPVEDKDYYDVFHIFNIRHPERDQLRQYLLDSGIKTEIHYPVSPNKQQAMRGILDQAACPISEEIHATTLSLPISYATTLAEVRTVVDCLNAFVSRKRGR